jgi:hypothetical protein
MMWIDAGSRSDKDSPGRDRYRPWGKVILNVSYFSQSLGCMLRTLFSSLYIHQVASLPSETLIT